MQNVDDGAPPSPSTLASLPSPSSYPVYSPNPLPCAGSQGKTLLSGEYTGVKIKGARSPSGPQPPIWPVLSCPLQRGAGRPGQGSWGLRCLPLCSAMPRLAQRLAAAGSCLLGGRCPLAVKLGGRKQTASPKQVSAFSTWQFMVIVKVRPKICTRTVHRPKMSVASRLFWSHIFTVA